MKSICWKNKPSSSGLLYVIIDKAVIESAKLNILSLADKLALYGVDILQLRVKNITDRELLTLAKTLAGIIHKRKKILIINDRADIAYAALADGIHIGENDITYQTAREILGNQAIIGRTIHSLDELRSVQNEKFDYLSVGPVFKTKTKPDLAALGLKQLKLIITESKKLIFAIGGINLYNIDSLLAAGVKNFALCRGIILNQNIKDAIKEYKQCLREVS